MTLDIIKIYLPKFLSSESSKELFDGLKDFPNNIDSRFYTNHIDESILYQGDGIMNMPVINLPDNIIKNVDSIVMSNTCDISDKNIRFFPSQIMYAPIVNLDKYKSGLMKKIPDLKKINAHIASIKKQHITQIFYLPSYGSKFPESIVFLDRLYNINNSFIDTNRLSNNRIFTLSDFGVYVFILKLSIHFTRIQDKVERKSSRI